MQGSPNWKLAYDTYMSGPRGSKQDLPPRSVGPRDALRLLSSIGCMCCGKPRIRKVCGFLLCNMPYGSAMLYCHMHGSVMANQWCSCMLQHSSICLLTLSWCDRATRPCTCCKCAQVTWGFQLRICDACLKNEDLFIAGYKLEQQYDLPQQLFAHLPHHCYEAWYYRGTITVRARPTGYCFHIL